MHKVFGWIRNERVKAVTDVKAMDEQEGFRAGRGCNDQIKICYQTEQLKQKSGVSLPAVDGVPSVLKGCSTIVYTCMLRPTGRRANQLLDKGGYPKPAHIGATVHACGVYCTCARWVLYTHVVS